MIPAETQTKLIQSAMMSGASDAVMIAATDICIDPDLAEHCRTPGCENYGLSKSCPPHIPGPKAFKRQLKEFHQAVFLKIDLPSEILYSHQRIEAFQLLHEIASKIEQDAVQMGFSKARAYAGGSCKKIFCNEYDRCAVVSENGSCRNPLTARPSMSGFGIDVAKLFTSAGWVLEKASRTSASSSMASICALVLID